MEYPEISLDYMRTLTDCTGIMQHGVHGVPNRRLGYTTDDNARALIVATKYFERTHKREDLDLAICYLSYMHYAQNAEHKFQNVMDYRREFLDRDGTPDCYGRSIWGLGYAASSGLPENVRIVAKKMFDNSIAWAADFESPRTRAYSILGMCNYMQAYDDGGDLRSKINAFADSLLVGLRRYGDASWRWFEPYMTYGNAILPLGMLVAAKVTGNKIYEEAARTTIDFLTNIQIVDGRLEIVGNNGWCFKGGKRAWYDQQTIDAGYTVLLYSTAYKILGDPEYLQLARISFDWFFGKNRAGVSLYDPITGGCYDAINPEGVNLNQGSESCICFLLAQLCMDNLI
jgi:hypothetical protein